MQALYRNADAFLLNKQYCSVVVHASQEGASAFLYTTAAVYHRKAYVYWHHCVHSSVRIRVPVEQTVLLSSSACITGRRKRLPVYYCCGVLQEGVRLPVYSYAFLYTGITVYTLLCGCTERTLKRKALAPSFIKDQRSLPNGCFNFGASNIEEAKLKWMLEFIRCLIDVHCCDTVSGSKSYIGELSNTSTACYAVYSSTRASHLV
jgi:hypothetical protein